VKWDMTKKLAGDILVIVEKEYFATLSRIKVLEDSLNVLRSMGVLHYKEQVKAYSKSYAKAIEKNDIPAMRRLEGKLDTLKKYGGAYQYIHDDLDKYSSKYPDIKMKYDEAMVNYTGLMPAKFVVEKAIPNEFKARPKRFMYILISVLACNIMGLFLLLIRDKFRKEIKPEVEKGQHSPQN